MEPLVTNGDSREQPNATDDTVARAADLAALGLRGRLPAGALARLVAATADPDARVRGAALAPLVGRGPIGRAFATWRDALDDPAPPVRRRAAELAARLGTRRGVDRPATRTALVARLGDGDVTVVEAAAWALGELGDDPADDSLAEAVEALARTATDHPDALAREAAVAALGAVGDDRGRAAVLAACGDKPAVRRRAVLALAPFDGPDVDAAIERALTDRDWQVRQAAEDLMPRLSARNSLAASRDTRSADARSGEA
jgi:HEAT repeat protein